MNRRLNKVVICFMVCLSVYCKTGVAFAESIVGSAHDFSSAGWNTTGEICVTCHTPHNADDTAKPLWNHELSTANYTLYSDSELTGTVGSPGQASKLCLSCHDGTVAVDSFGGTSGSSTISGNALVGTDLSNDHPVGVGGAQSLHTISYGNSCISCHESFPVAPEKMPLPFYRGGGREAKVECATCHDPHNNVPASNGKMLRKPKAGSELCFHCHNK